MRSSGLVRNGVPVRHSRRAVKPKASSTASPQDRPSAAWWTSDRKARVSTAGEGGGGGASAVQAQRPRPRLAPARAVAGVVDLVQDDQRLDRGGAGGVQHRLAGD